MDARYFSIIIIGVALAMFCETREIFSAVTPLFLIANDEGLLPEVSSQLRRETLDHQDILQSSRKEEYHKTAYKILGAYIWIQWYGILGCK